MQYLVFLKSSLASLVLLDSFPNSELSCFLYLDFRFHESTSLQRVLSKIMQKYLGLLGSIKMYSHVSKNLFFFIFKK